MTRPTASSPGRREPDSPGERDSGVVLTDADRLHAALDAALAATTRHQGNSD